MGREDKHASFAQRALAASGGTADFSGLAATPCPPRAASDDVGYRRWLGHASERLDPPLAFLGVLFAMLVVFELANPGLSDEWRLALAVAGWCIWGVFLVDFMARLLSAPSRREFLRGNWLAVLMLLIPTLRVLRLGALLRLGRALPAARVISSSYRVTGVARNLFRSRLAYLSGVAAIIMLGLAQLGWLFERGHDTFGDFGDALLWSAALVIGLHADPTPQSAAGRLVMLSGFAVGLVLVATLAGTIGAYLLEGQRERDIPGETKRSGESDRPCADTSLEDRAG